MIHSFTSDSTLVIGIQQVNQLIFILLYEMNERFIMYKHNESKSWEKIEMGCEERT